MPFLRIQTNCTLSHTEKQHFMKEASRFIADLLEKAEAYVMVQLQDRMTMSFAGSDAPTALIELASLGLTEEQSKGIAPTICTWFTEKMPLTSDRIYIWYSSPDRAFWGFDGRTFG